MTDTWSTDAPSATLPDGDAEAGGPARERSPWHTVGVVLLGTYAFALNGHIIGVALPSIAADLGESSVFDIDWVITSFLVGVVLAQPITGWMSDRMGRRFVLVGSLGLFGIGALFCLVSPTLEVLLAGRFVQGMGGGALIPAGKAVIYDLFPPERRGRALSMWGVAVMAAPAAGPPIGGLIVTQSHWRWVFVVFAVVAAVGAPLSARLIPDVGYRDTRDLDGGGWVIAVAAVAIVVLGARQVPTWGATSPLTLGSAVVATLLMVVLVRRSARRRAPIIDFTMFRSATFSLGIAVITILGVAQYARLNFVPVELQVVRGMDAQTVGLLLAPAAIGVAVTMPVGGWLVDRIGARIPVTLGLLLTALGLWQLSDLHAEGSETAVVVALVTQGVGAGLASIPASVCALNSLHSRYVASASAMEALMRQLAGAVGIAVLSAVLVSQLGAVAPVDPDPQVAQSAYNAIFRIAFVLSLAGAVVAAFLPGPQRTREDHANRIAEL